MVLSSVLLAVTCALCAGAPDPDRRASLRGGLFALTNTTNWVTKGGKRVNLFDCEVDGVVNYLTWSGFEPEQGKLNTRGFTRMMSEAKAADKLVSFNVIPGTHAPDWVFTECGIQPYEMVRSGRPRRTYLPWVEESGKRRLNTEMLAVWGQTVKAYADMIHAHPERGRICYVAITGWPESNGLELMWGERDPEAFAELNWDREAQDLYIEFGKRCADLFLEAFPDIPLGIAFTDFYGANADGSLRRSMRESREIVRYAVEQGEAKGATVVPMGLWMGAKGIVTQPNHQLVRFMTELRDEAPGIALEGPMGSHNPGHVPLETQLKAALELGVAWVQLWHHDIVRDENQRLLRKYRLLFRDR